ncbi:MAG: FtsX-like permease family protein [Lentisphaerae bacterium]|nr:FtsX-like permease family protein [Lentisphaerota bacterium]
MNQSIGTQRTLPLRRAVHIAVSGIRIRIGRSLVTVSGVVLGIAFLMSNLTGQIVKTAVSSERDARHKVDLMMSLVSAEMGPAGGRTLAVAAFGQVSDVERAFLARVVAAGPAAFRALGVAMQGLTPVTADALGDGASLLFVIGDAASAPASIGDLTRGMSARVVLDTVAGRAYAGGAAGPEVRRAPFFGQEAEQQEAEMAAAARQERFRITWIIAVSLMVTVVTVANALLMSVTERFREIGTMKCLGALSSFIRTLFLIESALIGMAGSVLGAITGAAFTLVIYGFTYRFGTVFGSTNYGWLLLAGGGAVVCGTLMAMAAAIYPARVASRMVPADALRSTV